MAGQIDNDLDLKNKHPCVTGLWEEMSFVQKLTEKWAFASKRAASIKRDKEH